MFSSFGAKLRYLRLQRELTQIELARQLSLATNTHISQMEAGIREPSLMLVCKIAEYFGVTIDFLLRDAIPVTEPQRFQSGGSAAQETPALFGSKLRHLRRQWGLTQMALARQIQHITHTHVSHLEAGRKEPSINLVLRLADFFGVTTDYLLWDNEPISEPLDL